MTGSAAISNGSAPASAPSGEQFAIADGRQRATIVEVGGGIRDYRVGERQVLDPYPVDQVCDGAHGAPLIPWPNRLADGRYTFDGVDYQVAITEPETSTAIHGLLRWENWRALSHGPAEVVVGNVLHPRTGYPFTLDVRVGYRLDGDGLTVTTTATNIGRTPAPWATGAHPYLSPGDGLVDDAELEFAAAVRVETDERLLPTGQLATAATEYDFGVRRRIGSLVLDDAFRELGRDPAGRASVRLTGHDGRCVRLWLDESYPYVQLFTGDTLKPMRRRRGLGAEPMSAPPNAFATGDSVTRLEPGATAMHRWGVQLRERE